MGTNAMVKAVNNMTAWLSEKILPWVVITILGMVFVMAGKIITLENQLELIDTKIELAIMKNTNSFLEQQKAMILDNAQEIARLEICIKENKTMIDNITRRLNARQNN